ncbi:MAG: transporter substrate-binding domain-containing protein [Bacteroidales bacterium]|nr:transporter substrate-binding domain-containing protein [Bacteroidales bacterium]MCF8402645.1 transporter substrate-binding domain-containing protein [Bacteroidales bacterium]
MEKLIRILTIVLMTVSFFFSGFPQKYLKKIQDRGELRIGMTLKQPPFSMKDAKGNNIGFEVEIVEMLAKSMEVELKIIEIPFADLLTALEEGKVDMVMSGMTITVKRNLKAVFVGPYMVSGKSILTRSAAFSDTDEPADLNKSDLKIVALRGSTSELFVKKEIPDATLLLGKDYDECIKMLDDRKAQIMVADYPICAYTAQIFPEKGLITIDKPLTIEPIGVALPSDAAHFINLVENYLNKLAMTGALDEMNEYWFESGEWINKVLPFKGINIY